MCLGVCACVRACLCVSVRARVRVCVLNDDKQTLLLLPLCVFFGGRWDSRFGGNRMIKHAWSRPVVTGGVAMFHPVGYAQLSRDGNSVVTH